MRKKEIQRKLYRAPELLSHDKESQVWGSQKGDIYSFGILLYEIVGRSGPWGRMNALEEGTSILLLKTHQQRFAVVSCGLQSKIPNSLTRMSTSRISISRKSKSRTSTSRIPFPRTSTLPNAKFRTKKRWNTLYY